MTALVMSLILSCAKISSPTGGPKDTEPPVIVKSEPANGSVMFREKSFTVTFNEYVVLDRITEKFMVSPPLKEKPVVKLRGKSLVVNWQDDLTDSTTYTFYFQDAIRDNNENNPIPNFQYVFSTGPVLDSLSLSGNVFDASNLEVVEDVMVMMYSNLADTAPRKMLPAYISRPDATGGFIISNVRPGHYRLYALKDLNGNRLYDLDDEIFAFCDTVIEVNPEENYSAVLDTLIFKPSSAPQTTKPDKFTFGVHRLYAFRQESKKQYLKFTDRRSAWSIGFGLALPSESGQVSVSLTDTPPGSWYMESNASRDTFMLWITSQDVFDRDIIEGLLTYPFTDSTGSLKQKTDTVMFRYQRPAQGRAGSAKPQALSLVNNLTGKIRPGVIPSFIASAPLTMPDTSRITLVQIIDTIRTSLTPEFMKDSLNSRRIFMTTQLKPGVTYSMICRAGAFSDIYGNKNDSISYRIEVAKEDDFGSVTVSLSGYEGQVIVQLLGEKEKLLREEIIASPGKAVFGLLDKGKYRLKAIYDIDSSRTWTTGDYGKLREPEPVTYYPGEIDVKINWSLEQEWDISKVYNKDVSLRNKPAVKR